MDMKNLMQKLEQIDKKKVLTESSAVSEESRKVKGKGYDHPDNERKAPGGEVPDNPWHDSRSAKFLAKQVAGSDKNRKVKGRAQSSDANKEKDDTNESFAVSEETRKVKGKGYDHPDNERKAPSGEVPDNPWHDSRSAKFLAKQVAGSDKNRKVKGRAQSSDANKEKDGTNESISFKSSIARALLKEFNLDEADPTTTVSTPAGAPSYAKDISVDGKTGSAPAAKLSPEQMQDPYIVNRVLGKNAVPISNFKDPADQAIAKQLGFKDIPKGAGGAVGTVTGEPQMAPVGGAASSTPAKGTGATGMDFGASAAAGTSAKPDPQKLARFKELIAKAGGEKRTAAQLATTADISQSGTPN